VGSLVASSVDCGIYINTQREVAVPASKSFSSQVTALLMVGVWISFHKDHSHMKPFRMALKDNIRQLPINFGLNLKLISEECKKLAHLVSKETFLMVLGKGDGLAIAKEGALKIKEITYIHAEAFSAGEMKHGPIALI
jgi:glucosamine--fructose-6-phosphate aminotransferase (isomerizing)